MRCGGLLAREGLEGEECWAASGKRERKTNYYTQKTSSMSSCVQLVCALSECFQDEY